MTKGDLTLRELLKPIVEELLENERPAPLMISQRNSEAMLGVPSRLHLEFCRRADFSPRVARVGKLRLVDAIEYRAWLIHSGSRSASAESNEESGADALLRELGLELRKAPPPGLKSRRSKGAKG